LSDFWQRQKKTPIEYDERNRRGCVSQQRIPLR
jgi:hypothetical protein